MPALDTTLLSNLAAQAARLLPDLCTIQYAGVTLSGKHGTAGWTVRSTNVPCRLAADKQPPARPDAADRLMVRQPWLITVPLTAVVNLRDQIVIGARTFEVVDTLTDSWPVSQQVRAIEVT